MVERAKILFPLSQIGAVTPEQRTDFVKRSRLYGRYDHPVDRESAYELITAATQEAERQKAELEAAADAVSSKVTGKKKKSTTSTGSKMVTKTTKSATTTLTKELTRSILGNLLK